MNHKFDAINTHIHNLRERGSVTPDSIAQIHNFPYMSFNDMKKDVQSGNILVQRFSFKYNTDIFNLLAAPIDKYISNIYMASMYLSPIFALLISYFVSWWFVIAIFILPVISMKGIKRTYNKIILSSALNSELEFVFLFFCGQVALVPKGFSKSIYWDDSVNGANITG